jgi:hypothetical protein
MWHCCWALLLEFSSTVSPATGSIYYSPSPSTGSIYESPSLVFLVKEDDTEALVLHHAGVTSSHSSAGTSSTCPTLSVLASALFISFGALTDSAPFCSTTGDAPFSSAVVLFLDSSSTSSKIHFLAISLSPLDLSDSADFVNLAVSTWRYSLIFSMPCKIHVIAASVPSAFDSSRAFSAFPVFVFSEPLQTCSRVGS